MPYLHYKIMINKVVEVLKQFQADKDACLEHNQLLQIEKKPGYSQIKVIQKSEYVSGTLSPSINQLSLKKIVQELTKRGIDADLDISMPTGDLFGNFGQIENVFDEGKTMLAHKPGEVLLIDVWATWCPPCQQPMSRNQQMLENNPLWNDKVRIIALNVDKKKKTAKQRVQQKKWTKLTHLTLLGWSNDNPFIKYFRIQGIPFVCLVDKFGKINYIGHPNQINLQSRINDLVYQEKEDQIPKREKQTSDEEIEKFVLSLTKEKVQELFKDASLFCFQLNMKSTHQNGVTITKGYIDAFVNPEQLNSIEKAHSFFGDHPGFQLNIGYAQYISIPNIQGAKCWECASPLKYPFYWLNWEEGNKFGCLQCIEGPSHIEGHHFKYEKNSILLTGKWQKLAVKNIGKNIQPAHPKDVQKSHPFLCNICNEPCKEIGEVRYICEGCRLDPNFGTDYLDICQKCITKVVKGDPDIMAGLLGEGHERITPF